MLRLISKFLVVVGAASIALAAPLNSTLEIRQYSFQNPVVYADFPDNDVFRGPDDAYYFSASNMHYSPGAPILRSLDLVNWEVVGHSIPWLSSSPLYNQDGGNAYIGGSWASTLRYRKSNGLWYWIGCIDFGKSYVYTASEVGGLWTLSSTIDTCYYDCGLLIDDDDKMYVVYGANDIYLAELDAPGLAEVSNRQIFGLPAGVEHMEGNRLYKKDGIYYVLNDSPSDQSTYVWKSNSLYGSWEYKLLGASVQSPVNGGGSPHQGSLIQTPDNRWFIMSFTWAYPSGRLPVLAPVEWGADGFPSMVTVNGGWGATYPNPLPLQPTSPWTGTDTFSGVWLSRNWEWNHNADWSKFKVDNGLTLSTATVTNDLFNARNTLTRRAHGTNPVATVVIDFSQMADGDRCGLSTFRDWTASIGIERSGDSYSLVMRDGLTLALTTSWLTKSLGWIGATAPINKGKVWLRGTMDLRADGSKQGSFSYSTDGYAFTPFGPAFNLNPSWEFFPGYRWAIFNFAQTALGGSIFVSEFSQY